MWLRSFEVLPLRWRSSGLQPPPSATDAPSNSVASNAVTSSAYVPVWDSYVDAAAPLCSWAAYAGAANDSYLHEFITGQQVIGKAALTATPHDHDGANSVTVDLPLLSHSYGWPPVDGVGIDQDAGTPQGYGFDAPGNSTDNGQIARIHSVQTPARTGSPSLNWAITAYNVDGETCPVRIDISTDGSSWSAASTESANDNGWNCAEGTKTFTTATEYWVRAVVDPTGTPSAPIYITGLALWVT